MKRLAFFALLVSLIPNFVAAQVQPLTVTLVQPGQPASGQAYAGQTVAAVAVTVQSNSLAHVSAIKVQRVGSLDNAAIASLQVNTDANTVVGTASGFDANNTATIPVSATTDSGSSKTFLVSAVMASNLAPYVGQSFELNITGVTTDAVTTKGTLPVYGAQFTISTTAAKPTCSISATTATYTVGQTINVRWTSTNATGGTITGIGNVGPSGLQGILPGGQSQTLTGTFTGPGGTGTCSLALTLTSSTGGTVSSSDRVDSASGVPNASGSFGSTNGGTVTAGKASGGAGSSVSAPTTPTRQGNIIPCSGLDCRPCDFAALAQNVINFLVGLSIPIAAVVFATAGVLYFTSAANPKGIDKAKRMFKYAFLGFLIAISGWLVVQVLLRSTLGANYYQSWNTIQCYSGSRAGTTAANSTDAGSFFTGNIGGVNLGTPGSVPLNTSGSVTGSGGLTGTGASYCPSSSTYSSAINGCVDNATGECTYSNCGINASSYVNQNFGSFSGAGNSGAGTAQWKSDLTGYCTEAQLDSSECTLAQAIMANESSGRPNLVSRANCVGLMQVCPATACDLDPSVSGCSSGNYAQVTQALMDPQTNMRLGTQLIGDLSDSCQGDYACIAAAYNGGIGATRQSRTCAGTTVWECTANQGYAETRVYVPRVLGTFNRLQ